MHNSELENNFKKKFVLETVEENFKGKYLVLATKKYILVDTEKKIQWECCYRTNSTNYEKITGVEVIALVKENNLISDMNNLKIILIENYRYPVDKKVLEFPSGIIDHHEFKEIEALHCNISSCEDKDEKLKLNNQHDEIFKRICINAASRELKEETGYIGKFNSFFSLPNTNPLKIFENNFYDPWKSGENGALCIFEIDKNSEENKNPKQELDECEIIKTHEVRIEDLLSFISEKMENEYYGCSQHVYSFAMGLQFSNLLKNLQILN